MMGEYTTQEYMRLREELTEAKGRLAGRESAVRTLQERSDHYERALQRIAQSFSVYGMRQIAQEALQEMMK